MARGMGMGMGRVDIRGMESLFIRARISIKVRDMGKEAVEGNIIRSNSKAAGGMEEATEERHKLLWSRRGIVRVMLRLGVVRGVRVLVVVVGVLLCDVVRGMEGRWMMEV